MDTLHARSLGQISQQCNTILLHRKAVDPSKQLEKIGVNSYLCKIFKLMPLRFYQN